MQTLGPDTLSTLRDSRDSNFSLLQSFLKFVSNPETSVPLNSNFLIQFEIPFRILYSNDSFLLPGYENWEPNSNDWKTLIAKRNNAIIKHQSAFSEQSNVSLFANGINLPVESLAVERGTVLNNGGLLGGVYGNNRAQQGTLTTTFIETDVSFIDFVLRPWIILTSHFGLLARGGLNNIKTNLTVFAYSKQIGSNSNNYTKVAVRKIYKFYNCAPVGLTDSGFAKHDWGKNSSLPVAGVQWVYNYYTISTPPN